MGALRHPARLIPASFAGVIAVGTGLLMLPAATAGGGGASFSTALFTSTSAVCVTGLAVVDTGTYWSDAGQVVILALIQVGGLGILTLTTLGVVLLGRRMGLRQRFTAQAGAAGAGLGSVKALLAAIGAFTLLFEATFTVVLWLRFWLAYDMSPGVALWHGLFHTVSAFNNAGFGLPPEQSRALRGGSDRHAQRRVPAHVWWARLPRLAAESRSACVGAVGGSTCTPGSCSSGTAALVVAGFATVLAFEWSNPATLGQFGPADKVLPAFFQGVTPRTAGFNTLDYAGMTEETWLTQMMLMFVGAGPASTAGGIKVTSFVVLLLFVLSEARGVARHHGLSPAHPGGGHPPGVRRGLHRPQRDRHRHPCDHGGQ